MTVPATAPSLRGVLVGPLPAVGEAVHCTVFASGAHGGNHTVVVRLDSWPATARLSAIARRYAPHEVTFARLDRGGVELRWFAATMELPLCGHGALAAAALLLPALPLDEPTPVANLKGRLWLLPRTFSCAIVMPRARLIERALDAVLIPGLAPTRVFDSGRDLLMIVRSEKEVRNFDGPAARLHELPKLGCLISGPAAHATACFRFFVPRTGTLEDSASASVVPALMAYWSPPTRRAQFVQCAGSDVLIYGEQIDDKVCVTGDVVELAREKVLDPSTASLTSQNAGANG